MEKTQPRKRVGVENIEDNNNTVNFVSIISSTFMGVLLVILTSSIDILVFYTSIYIYFMYKLMFISNVCWSSWVPVLGCI